MRFTLSWILVTSCTRTSADSSLYRKRREQETLRLLHYKLSKIPIPLTHFMKSFLTKVNPDLSNPSKMSGFSSLGLGCFPMTSSLQVKIKLMIFMLSHLLMSDERIEGDFWFSESKRISSLQIQSLFTWACLIEF